LDTGWTDVKVAVLAPNRETSSSEESSEIYREDATL
jgi:hypothetical protein